jgi:hypothetical protein
MVVILRREIAGRARLRKGEIGEGHDLGRADKLLRLVSRFSAWGWLFAKKPISVAKATPLADSGGTTKVVPFPCVSCLAGRTVA